MADGTKIEWADATLNYANGCSRVSPGCGGPGPHGGCYAEQLAGTRLRNHPTRIGLTKQTPAGPRWTGDVRIHEPALEQALRWKRGRKIFWNAHGDLFHEKVTDEQIDRLFAVCALTPQHMHMILTKRSARMREYLSRPGVEIAIGVCALGLVLDEMVQDPNTKLGAGVLVRGTDSTAGALVAWPLKNVWLGVSVEDQQRANERIPDLLAAPAVVRFISAEPLLGPVDLTWVSDDSTALDPECWGDCNCDSLYGYDAGCRRNGGAGALERKIDWVIVGGESGPKARPMHPEWARSLRDQCQAAGVSFLFKQWGEWAPLDHVELTNEVTPAAYLMPDGTHLVHGGSPVVAELARVGKKAAGRMLDGREWSELPA